MSLALRDVVAGALAALVMAATVSAAQQRLPEIEVQGQRDVFANNEGKLVTRTRRVRYADLNLATPTGVAELQKRVSDAAADVCHQLLLLYPPEVSGGFLHTNENCARNAIADAMKQADGLTAMARRDHASPKPLTAGAGS